MPIYHGSTIGRGVVLKTPSSDGDEGQPLTTDGSGNLVFGGVITKAITAPYTVLATDVNKLLVIESGTGEITIPDVMDDGDSFALANIDPSNVVTVAGSGITLTVPGDRFDLQGMASFIMVNEATRYWLGEGNLRI